MFRRKARAQRWSTGGALTVWLAPVEEPFESALTDGIIGRHCFHPFEDQHQRAAIEGWDPGLFLLESVDGHYHHRFLQHESFEVGEQVVLRPDPTRQYPERCSIGVGERRSFRAAGYVAKHLEGEVTREFEARSLTSVTAMVVRDVQRRSGRVGVHIVGSLDHELTFAHLTDGS